MLKEILIGIGAGASILVVGGGVVIAQRPSLAPAQEAASFDAQIVAIARQAERPERPALDRMRENLAYAEQSPTRSVNAFCKDKVDVDTCRTAQYAGNQALVSLYRQIAMRSNDIEAHLANLCTETQTHGGITDWRGTIDCFVAARQRVSQAGSVL